jgi:hypothetical protein
VGAASTILFVGSFQRPRVRWLHIVRLHAAAMLLPGMGLAFALLFAKGASCSLSEERRELHRESSVKQYQSPGQRKSECGAERTGPCPARIVC